jgi:hypothetical protein
MKPLEPVRHHRLPVQRKKLVLPDRHGISAGDEKIEDKRGTSSAFFLQIMK